MLSPKLGVPLGRLGLAGNKAIAVAEAPQWAVDRMHAQLRALGIELPAERVRPGAAHAGGTGVAGLGHVGFVDAGARDMLVIYAVPEYKVYVLGSGSLASLRHKFLKGASKVHGEAAATRAQRAADDEVALADLPYTDEELNKLDLAQRLRSKCAHQREKLFTLFTDFSCLMFDSLVIGDISTSSILRSGTIGNNTKRSMALLAMERLRDHLRRGSQALSPHRSFRFVARQPEAFVRGPTRAKQCSRLETNTTSTQTTRICASCSLPMATIGASKTAHCLWCNVVQDRDVNSAIMIGKRFLGRLLAIEEAKAHDRALNRRLKAAIRRRRDDALHRRNTHPRSQGSGETQSGG